MGAVAPVATESQSSSSLYTQYLNLFNSLRESGSLCSVLSDSDIKLAQAASNSLDQWRAFLSGGGNENNADARRVAALLRRHLALFSVLPSRFIASLSTNTADLFDDPQYERDPFLSASDSDSDVDYPAHARLCAVFPLLGHHAEESSVANANSGNEEGELLSKFVSEVCAVCGLADRPAAEMEFALGDDADMLRMLEECRVHAVRGEWGVEECVTEVTAIVRQRMDEDIITEAEKLADQARSNARQLVQTRETLGALRRVTVGILGPRRFSTDVTEMKSAGDVHMEVEQDNPEQGDLEKEQSDTKYVFRESELRKWQGSSANLNVLLEQSHRPSLPLFQVSYTEPSVHKGTTAQALENASAALNSDLSEKLKSPPSFADILGRENLLLSNVAALSRVRKLRDAVVTNLRGSGAANLRTPVSVAGSSTSEPRISLREPFAFDASTDEQHIRNVPLPARSSFYVREVAAGHRQRSMASAVTALICEHAGFSGASLTALETLTEVWEGFMETIGKALSSARERIGDDEFPVKHDGAPEGEEEARERTVEQVAVIFEKLPAGGGLAKMKEYALVTVPKISESLNVMERRLKMVHERHAPGKMIVFDEENTGRDEDVDKMDIDGENVDATQSFNEATWVFGYLAPGVVLDILGECPPVPQELGLAVLGCVAPNSEMEEKGQKSDAQTDVKTENPLEEMEIVLPATVVKSENTIAAGTANQLSIS